MTSSDFLLGGGSLAVIIFLIIAFVAAIVMPFFVIAIDGKVKKILDLERVRFVYWLYDAPVTLPVVESLRKAGYISKRDAENIAKYRSPDEIAVESRSKPE